MTRMEVSFELTNAQKEALEFEAEAENKTLEEMVGWIVRENIPPLLDVIETNDNARRQVLRNALIAERI